MPQKQTKAQITKLIEMFSFVGWKALPPLRNPNPREERKAQFVPTGAACFGGFPYPGVGMSYMYPTSERESTVVVSVVCTGIPIV